MYQIPTYTNTMHNDKLFQIGRGFGGENSLLEKLKYVLTITLVYNYKG